MLTQYHQFVTTKTWGYKIVLLISFCYSSIPAVIVYLSSPKPLLFQIQYHFVLFCMFALVQFILFFIGLIISNTNKL